MDFFLYLVVFHRNSNCANVESPFSDFYICNFLFLYFHSILLSSFLSFMLLTVFSIMAIMPRAPSNFMFPSLFSWILPVCISFPLLSWSLDSFLFCILKSLQQNISSHLLLGKILLVGIYLLLLISYDEYFLFFFSMYFWINATIFLLLLLVIECVEFS